MSSRQAPPIAFLGFVERWAQVQDGDPRPWKHNILGLKPNIFSMIYPFILTEGNLARAIYGLRPSCWRVFTEI